jgi:ubiquitin C-terminal hydrolase
LKQTPYDTLIQQLYTGLLSNLIICQQCGVSRKREETFLDLPIQVKGLAGVEESLKQFFEFDKLEDTNKLFCDNCNEKTDTLKGPRI